MNTSNEQILQLINDGFGIQVISQRLGITTKKIRHISKLLGVFDILRENNQQYKINQIKKIAADKHQKSIDYYLQKHSHELIQLLKSGCNLNQIKSGLSEYIPTKKIIELTKILGIHEHRLENSKKSIRETALTNSLAGAKKIKGQPMRPITDELVAFYKECIELGVYETAAKKDIQVKFGHGHTGRNTWNRLIDEFGKLPVRPKAHYGKNNPQFGKDAHPKSGNGIKGHIFCFGQKMFFRSSLELMVFLYLTKNDIKFALSKHRIEYEFNEKFRHYFPDIVILDTVYEIKPKCKVNWPQNVTKHSALELYCTTHHLKCNIITEDTFPIYDITSDYVEQMIEDSKIVIIENEYKRLKKYLNKWHKK